MISKIYDKVKEFIKKNYKVLLIYLILFVVLTYRLPYYIYTGGGVINTSSRVEISNGYTSSGKFNFAYVNTKYATIPTYLLGLILDDWDIEKESDYKYNDNETEKDLIFRNQLDLRIANSNAIYNAYMLAGKDIDVTKKDIYITYLTEKNDSDLKIGDILLKIDNQDITDLSTISEVINNKEGLDKVDVLVNRDGSEINCSASIYLEDNKKMIGISIDTLYQYKTSPEIKLNFTSNESGPSGGLMLALTIYNDLIADDLTNGLNIVGTGTIDTDGKIGAIGGVKYKLAGAVANKADVFLVPNEINYDECIKLMEEKNYNIKIIGVDSLDDAINKLKEL